MVNGCLGDVGVLVGWECLEGTWPIFSTGTSSKRLSSWGNRGRRIALSSTWISVDLIESASGWPRYALKRHNDAAHPLYAIATLADLGLERDDPGIERFADAVLEHFDGTGFETLLWLPRFLTKEDDREWGADAL